MAAVAAGRVMRPPYAKPSRHLLKVAAAMFRPLDRHAPIATAITPKNDDRQLDLHRVERKDAPKE